MIIARRHGFIFLKTRKTAGSSIEIALSRFCGPDDTVTRMAAEDEVLRREMGGYGPAGHDKPLARHSPVELWKRLRHGRKATRFSNHAGASVAQSLVSASVWRESFKFTAERNPWDKAVSRYYWQRRRWDKRPRRQAFPTFEEYLAYLESEKPHWLSCWSIYTLGDEVAVDDFIFYEDLIGSLGRVARRIGLEGKIQLPGKRAKGGHRQTGADYRAEYTDGAREIVERVCRREIATFGYRFDEPEFVPRYIPSPPSTDSGPASRGQTI